MRQRKYTDYAGDVTATVAGGPDMYVNVGDMPPDGAKIMEICDSHNAFCSFRVTVVLDKDAAIRLALRLLPQQTMIQVAQMLTDEANAND